MTQTITLSPRSVTVHTFTGKVASSSKNLETRVHGGGGGSYSYQGTGTSAPVTISSTTVVHDQLFLVNKEGREIAVQLEGWDVACREGNIVTAMWGIIGSDKQGEYFAIINHSTGSKTVKKQVIKSIARSCSAPFGGTVNPQMGCFILIAMVALVVVLFKIWWPLGVAAIGYGLYFESKVKKNARVLNATIEYPTVVPW